MEENKMPVTNVKTQWEDGKFQFLNKDSDTIMELDGSNRAVDIPSGAVLKLAGTQVTVTADEINAITAGAALVGTMVAGTADADHADDTSETEIEVLAANGSGDGDRAILIIVNVTESFAATTNKPIFEIYNGDVVTYATIGHGGDPAAPSADETYTFAGELGEEKALVIAVTDGTGGAAAGAIEVYAIALPADTGA
jgi:hypothetical protein